MSPRRRSPELEAHFQRVAAAQGVLPGPRIASDTQTKSLTSQKRSGAARGTYQPGVMNDTEKRYESHLAGQRLLGKITWFLFEPVKLRLARATFYTPDFMVMREGRVEFHEVKGFWQEDARVKIKVAASLYPKFKFIAVKRIAEKQGGGWKVEEF